MAIKDCSQCNHKVKNTDGGWCYMFEEEPRVCGRFEPISFKKLISERDYAIRRYQAAEKCLQAFIEKKPEMLLSEALDIYKLEQEWQQIKREKE